MFNNIYSKTYEGSNSTTATVDGADVRYVVTFVSDGANCAVACGVYHVGLPGETQAFHALMCGEKIRQF